ncbi:MAG: secretion system protein [Aeromicrobium sp.]|nr:secretion system protein [Aeromicrobium sp.]
MDGFLVLGILLLVAAAVAALFASGVVGISDAGVRQRLGGRPAVEDEPAQLRTVAESDAAGWVRRIVSPSALATVERDVQLAGRPEGFTVARILVLKTVVPVVVILLGVLTAASKGITPFGLILWFILVAGAYVLPGVLIGMRATARQDAIDLSLPDVLDQLTISIDAGLSLETAISRTSERLTGPLADELRRTMQDVQLGMTRHDAYVALGRRNDSENLRRFVRSMTQAQEFGVPVSQVVRQQSAELRQRRQLVAEARASKVPVKLLFPMMVCIFPVLFIVALTPPIVNAAANW